MNNSKTAITLTYFRFLAIIVTAAVIAAFVVNYVIDQSFQTRIENAAAETKTLAAAITNTQCRSGNLRSAYELANNSDGPERSKLAESTQTINNCIKQSETGLPHPVTEKVQREFVHIVVTKHRQPIINSNGHICGTLPLPSSLRKPSLTPTIYQHKKDALELKCDQ